MNDKKPATKRRSVSKARLYKELQATLEAKNIGDGDSVEVLMNAIKDDIITEALKK